MHTEPPYPGQLWKHGSIRVIVVAVSPNTVTYEDLFGPAGVTRDHLSNFLTVYARLNRPSRMAPSASTRDDAETAPRSAFPSAVRRSEFH